MEHTAYGHEPTTEYYCNICDRHIKCKGFPRHLKTHGITYFDYVKDNIEFTFQYFISAESRHSYDFKIKNINLIIEVDGDYWHGGPGCKIWCDHIEYNRTNDIMKTQVALDRGITVIRFWGSEIEKNVDYVFGQILYEIDQRTIKNDTNPA